MNIEVKKIDKQTLRIMGDFTNNLEDGLVIGGKTLDEIVEAINSGKNIEFRTDSASDHWDNSNVFVPPVVGPSSTVQETVYKESLAEKLKVASNVYFGFVNAKSEHLGKMTPNNLEEMNLYFCEAGQTILHLLKEMRK